MEMHYEGVPIYVLPDCAVCKADKYKRSPLDIDVCPYGYEICACDCDQYCEEW